jgi:hypothetical protein
VLKADWRALDNVVESVLRDEERLIENATLPPNVPVDGGEAAAAAAEAATEVLLPLRSLDPSHSPARHD